MNYGQEYPNFGQEQHNFGQEQQIDKTVIFKMPSLPPLPPTLRTELSANQCNQTISGSVESLTSKTSGYQSDEYPIDTSKIHKWLNPAVSKIFKWTNPSSVPQWSNPGMKNIPTWLKSLRLHKYTWVFEDVSYERMFSFSEEYFESKDITQGARHKLAICIEKLKLRSEVMQQIELKLAQNRMYVPEAIFEMESIVLSPMKPMRSSGINIDVGYQLWRVICLGKFLRFLYFKRSKQ